MEILLGLLAGLGAFLHAGKLMVPITLECARPFVQWLNGVGVGSIKHLSSLPSDIHKTDFEQHPKVLRNRRLGQTQRGDNVIYGALLGDEEGEDVAATRFGDGVEGVGGGGGARHERIIFLYGNMSSVIFGPSDMRAGF
jgi:hypothetical protein